MSNVAVLFLLIAIVAASYWLIRNRRLEVFSGPVQEDSHSLASFVAVASLTLGIIFVAVS